MGKLTHKALERQLLDQEFSALLVAADLAERDGARTIADWLAHTRDWLAACADRLDQLLAWRLSSRSLSCRLMARRTAMVRDVTGILRRHKVGRDDKASSSGSGRPAMGPHAPAWSEPCPVPEGKRDRRRVYVGLGSDGSQRRRLVRGGRPPDVHYIEPSSYICTCPCTDVHGHVRTVTSRVA